MSALQVNKAVLMNCVGKLPFLGNSLRRAARFYREGSTVTIRNGYLAGYRWKRSHRYVSGYWLGTYELPVQQCLCRELHPGDVFYDIGANAGFFSLVAAKCVGDRGHVFAFEPLPENAEMIRYQFELNELTNSTLVDAAVSDCAGKVEFSYGRDASTAHMTAVREGLGPSLTINAITVDEFAQSHPVPDFVKIDVEGAEAMVLRGASHVLQGDQRPRILVEFHSDALAQECCGLLRASHYTLLGLKRDIICATNLPHHVLALPAALT